MRTSQQVQLARENLARLRARAQVLLVEPVPYQKVYGTGFYEQFLDSSEWPQFMRAGREATLDALRAVRAEPGRPAARLTAVDPAPPGVPRPEPAFVLKELGGEVKRGAPLKVAGQVEADGSGCSFARVDVALRSSAGGLLPLGAVATDAAGRFAGSVTVALTVPVGDYDVVVSTPGDSRCGPGSSASAASRK